MLQQLKKVVAIGPECTGKSRLCELLSQHFNTGWVPEFAREYLLTHGKDYSYDDLLKIAKGRLQAKRLHSINNRQSETSKRNPPTPTPHFHSLLFIDTDMYVMKVWCEFVFG